jgi:hypothetical protein
MHWRGARLLLLGAGGWRGVLLLLGPAAGEGIAIVIGEGGGGNDPLL